MADLAKYSSRAPRWAPIVLMGPSCTSQVSRTILMLGCRVSLLASRGYDHGAGVPTKDTPMPKSVLSDVNGYREYLMCNQCIG